MRFCRRYSLVIGLLALVCVVLLLFSTPDILFSKRASFITTKLTGSSGSEAFVSTKMDLGDKEQMKGFPMEIGDWNSYGYDTSSIVESLGADVVLMRAYSHPRLYQPIFFLLVQSKAGSSFHPPPLCYRCQGYEVEEEGMEQLVISDASCREDGSSCSNGLIPLKKLVVFKESEGKILERRVVLYFYVKGDRFTSDPITMIRVSSALAPISGSYEGILEVLKDFTAQTIPYMFEYSQEEEGQAIAATLAESGIGGYFAIVLLISLPLAIMIYPRIRSASRSETEIEQKK
jgi:hypothetical protein